MFNGLAGLFIKELIDRGEMETIEEMGTALNDAHWIEQLEKNFPRRSQMNHEKLIKNLTDRGQLIEAGWASLRYAILPENTPEIQIREMRKVFFAGAHHLFASITNLLDEDAEPTPDDIRRLEMIHVELEAWGDSLKREASGMVDPL